MLVALPLLGVVLEAPWSTVPSEVAAPPVRRAISLSLLTASLATVASLFLGVPLAWVLARGRFRGQSFVRAVATVPMVLPPVVGGVALLLAFGRQGLVGNAFEGAGIHLPFSTAGVVVAQTFVAMPFLVVTMEAAFRTVDRRFEDAAVTLGASSWYAFRRVTLPLVGRGLAAGTVLAWSRALGEFGATITFAGNLDGETRTLPLAVYLALEGGVPERAVVLSLVLLLPTIAVTLVARRDRAIL